MDRPGPELTGEERSLLAGEGTEAERLSMQILVAVATAAGAPRLRPVTRAHIDSCLYHGRSGLDFARLLLAGGGRVRVPTTLNVSSLDLLHPDLYRGDPATAREAREMMDAYVAMGCRPTWTCAPYQLPDRPAFGEHVAWAESNAIVFANSVLGARTDRYGDFIDIAAAIVGKVPDAGLHRPEGRKATLVVDVSEVSASVAGRDDFPPLLGHIVGRAAGSGVPAIVGVERPFTEDDLKALGAAAASSGGVGLFHLVGVTPEASTLDDVVGTPGVERLLVGDDDIVGARRELSGGSPGRVDAVSVGTPHASATEIGTVAELLGSRRVRIPFYLSTGRDVLEGVPDVAERLEAAGVTLVVDTCTYITPILDPEVRVVMTNSAKWAYYAPGNLGVEVVFATLAECVESAVAGRIRREGDG